MHDHVKLLSCACEAERPTTDYMLMLTQVRQAIWNDLSREQQAKIAPMLTEIARELGRVDMLRVRASAAEAQVKGAREQLQDRRVPRYPSLVDPKQEG